MNLLSRVYIWSIVFEPLLFFILFQRALFGVPGNVSRILQLIVVVSLVLRFMSNVIGPRFASMRIVNFASPLYINFSIYYSLLIVAGLLGILTGAYDLPSSYQQAEALSGFSTVLNSATVRPIFEYAIAAYYFIYFAILPKYLLKTEKDVAYFFNVFRVVFIASFVIGSIDYILVLFGIEFVPRHIADGIHVGARFHGLAGEPRQGFLYLFLGLAVLHLEAYFKGEKLRKWWILAVSIAALLTQSVSGFLGIVAFLGLLMIYSLDSIKKIMAMFAICLFISVLFYSIIIHSERVLMYIESASDIWMILETKGDLPYLMRVQQDSIYPLYELTVKFRNYDFFPILIGSGLGSASVVNNVYADVVFGTSNPNSQFVRTLYESGIIGMIFFILAFTYPIKILTSSLSPKTQYMFIVYMLLLVGCSLGIRSSIAYIYLGIFIAAFSTYGENVSYVLINKDRYNVVTPRNG